MFLKISFHIGRIRIRIRIRAKHSGSATLHLSIYKLGGAMEYVVDTSVRQCRVHGLLYHIHFMAAVHSYSIFVRTVFIYE